MGLSAPAVCAAVRASLESFTETHFFDELGQPIIGAAIPAGLLGLAGESDGSIVAGDERLAQMLALAVTECALLADGLEVGRTALLIVGPEKERHALSLSGLQRCLDACNASLGQRLHVLSRAFQLGSAGLFDALVYADELLSSHAVQSVLVAGVDSFLNVEDINEALRDERLLTSGNPDGFVPGEAAACLLVTCSKEGSVRHSRALSISGMGMAHETQTLKANLPSRGVGLSKAIRQALDEARLPAHAVHARYADVSAESYFFEEASYGWGRVLRAPSPKGYKLFTPVTRVGHIGAAMGPLMIAILLDNTRKSWAAGANTLLHLSGSDTPRAALVVIAS